MDPLARRLRSMCYDGEVAPDALHSWPKRRDLLQWLLDRLLGGHSIDALLQQSNPTKKKGQSKDRLEAEEIAQKLTILGLPATAAQVQGSGDLSERIAFLEGLVDVALWAPEPTAVCASPSDATASGDHDSQCSRSDMDDGEDDFASNHELMGTICQSYSELFRHEVDLLPAEMIQGVEGNPRLDEIRLLIRQISSKVEEWQKERQAYDDLPKVAPQTVEELQEALSLACETLSAFAQDAQAFNQHFAQEYSQHVGVEPPQLHGIGPLAAKIINTYDDLVKVIERLGEFRGIHESLFGGKSPLKEQNARLFDGLRKFCVDQSGASLSHVAVLQEATNRTGMLRGSSQAS